MKNKILWSYYTIAIAIYIFHLCIVHTSELLFPYIVHLATWILYFELIGYNPKVNIGKQTHIFSDIVFFSYFAILSIATCLSIVNGI